MKKAILIFVFGLLLGGCSTSTVEEVMGDQYQRLYVGMSKESVRNKFIPVIIASDPTYGTCSYNYFPNFEAEILSSKDNTTHLVITEVRTKRGCGYAEGKFHSIHNTFVSAKKVVDNMKSIVKLNEEKKKNEITFTINDKKEQCEAIGFTPQTEKFADCVLRLVELDVKSQQQKQIELAISQGNQQVANELKAQRNQQSGEYLMNLSQQLLTPTAPASLPTTRNCSVRGTGVYKRVTCW